MQKIAFRYGLLMFLGLTGFFLLMHMLHLSEHYYLRIFNGVIHLGVLWMALSAWYKQHHGYDNDYFSGVAVGIFTSIVGIIPFTVFMAIFLGLNPGFLELLKNQTPIGEYLTPFTTTIFIGAEGLIISLIASYIFIRILEARHQPV